MRSSRLSDQQPHASTSGFAPPTHQPSPPRQWGQERQATGTRWIRCRSAYSCQRPALRTAAVAATVTGTAVRVRTGSGPVEGLNGEAGALTGAGGRRGEEVRVGLRQGRQQRLDPVSGALEFDAEGVEVGEVHRARDGAVAVVPQPRADQFLEQDGDGVGDVVDGVVRGGKSVWPGGTTGRRWSPAVRRRLQRARRRCC